MLGIFIESLKKALTRIKSGKNGHEVQLSWPIIKWYLNKLMKYKKILFFCFILLISTALIKAPLPLLVKVLFDTVIPSNQLNWLLILTFVFLFANILTIVIESLLSYFHKVIESKCILELQNELVKSVLKFPLQFFTNKQVGELMTRLHQDFNLLRALDTSRITEFIKNVLVFILGIIVLFYIHWKLTLVSVIFLPAIYYLIKKTTNFIHNAMDAVMKINAQVNMHLEQTLSNIMLIKASNTEKKEGEKIYHSLEQNMKVNFEAMAVNSVHSIILQVIGIVGTVIIFGYGGYEVMSNRLSIGGFLTFYTMIAYLYMPFLGLSQLNWNFQTSYAALNRIYNLFTSSKSEISILHVNMPKVKQKIVQNNLSLKKEKDLITNDKISAISLGNISYENISFSYTSDIGVLHDINLKIQAGSSVAIVGKNGSGKSTLIHLLLKFYEPSSGRMYIGDRLLQSIAPKVIRSLVAFVSQDIFLFDTSLQENLTYGLTESIDENKIYHCLNKVGLDQMVSNLPEGLNTRVGPSGVRLSGGEKRRISLARALLKDAPIWVLDEPTTSVDNDTISLINRNLKDLFDGRTVILVTHDVKVEHIVDRIVELKNGKIVEYEILKN